jgi:CheY-like chemotaxis protein
VSSTHPQVWLLSLRVDLNFSPDPMTMKVLIIDDDEAVRESMKKILEREDYEVLLASDGRGALEHIDTHAIDLLLLDIDLPVRGGWDVFEEFTTRRPSLPVIVITGHAGQYPVAQAAGVDAFMEKPIDAPQLLQTMREVLAVPVDQRLHRLLGRGGLPWHVPANARMIFEELREWHGLARQRLSSSAPPAPAGARSTRSNGTEN